MNPTRVLTFSCSNLKTKQKPHRKHPTRFAYLRSATSFATNLKSVFYLEPLETVSALPLRLSPREHLFWHVGVANASLNLNSAWYVAKGKYISVTSS